MTSLLTLSYRCGSGCVITFLAKAIQPLLCVATDLNPHATRATVNTALCNGAIVDAVLTSLVDGISARGRRLFDIVLFNPPYVPTEELCSLAVNPIKDHILADINADILIEATWAGGADGRHWIDRIIPMVDGLLSENGVMYMVVIDANKPEEIIKWINDGWGICAEMIARRRFGVELLGILKFWRKAKLPSRTGNLSLISESIETYNMGSDVRI